MLSHITDMESSQYFILVGLLFLVRNQVLGDLLLKYHKNYLKEFVILHNLKCKYLLLYFYLHLRNKTSVRQK